MLLHKIALRGPKHALPLDDTFPFRERQFQSVPCKKTTPEAVGAQLGILEIGGVSINITQ